MRRKRILLLSLMFLCFILSGTKKTYAGESGKEVSEVFQLTLYVDESLEGERDALDLSGIRIDVYSSELAAYDKESGGSTYTHNDFFSVYTDAEGQVQFSRPSETFLILVDVSTLPRNTGIAISTKFYRETITEDRLAISKVDKLIIEKIETSEEEFYVNAYNREGTRINVDFTLSEISSKISGNTKTVCLEARVGDITETCEHTVPVKEDSKFEIQYADDVEELFAYNEDDAEAYDADVNVAVLEETDQEGKWLFYGLICFWCFLKALLL